MTVRNILAKWNETDTSQFGTNLFAPTGTVTLDTTTSNLGTLLRLSFTNFSGLCLFPFAISGLPARYTVWWTIESYDVTGGGSSDQPVLCVAGNHKTDTSFRGLIISKGPGSNTPVETLEGTTAVDVLEVFADQWSRASGVICVGEYSVRMESQPTSGDPTLALQATGVANQNHGSDSLSTAGGDFNGPYSGWDGESTNAGVGIGHKGASTINGTVTFSGLVVFEHPMDVS